MTQDATATLSLNLSQPFETGKVNRFGNEDINMNITPAISNNTEMREEIIPKQFSRTLSQTPTTTPMQKSPKDSRNSVVITTDSQPANTTEENLDPTELMNALGKTLADFYGGGIMIVKDVGENYWKEPEKKAARSSVKESKIDSHLTQDNEQEIKIRDFAFPTDDLRHWGQTYPSSDDEHEYDEFANRRARALYDFIAENESELSFEEGDILNIQSRQCAGWLIADRGEETGLVPENYIALLGDNEEDYEEDYNSWVAAQVQELRDTV